MALSTFKVEFELLTYDLRDRLHNWHSENIAVDVDKAGNKSFHKGKSRDRIDGAVACAMAVPRAHNGDLMGSWYDCEQAEEIGLLMLKCELIVRNQSGTTFETSTYVSQY